MTGRLPFHFLLSCFGGGNGNPLQCSCLENPRDRGAWWAAVCGVAQSRTRLKRLSSSSSSSRHRVGCLQHLIPTSQQALKINMMINTMCFVFFFFNFQIKKQAWSSCVMCLRSQRQALDLRPLIPAFMLSQWDIRCSG